MEVLDYLLMIAMLINKVCKYDIKITCTQTHLLARSPDDPQRIRVASVFELFVCSLFVLCLSANFLIF